MTVLSRSVKGFPLVMGPCFTESMLRQHIKVEHVVESASWWGREQEDKMGDLALIILSEGPPIVMPLGPTS